MNWDVLYTKDHQPTLEEVGHYINSPLWNDLQIHLQETYQVKPSLSYSSCSMQRGWNIKYKKSSKSLCTLYPADGYFMALVVIGEKETAEAELLLTECTAYIQQLYAQTPCSMGARWLMIEVKQPKLLEDVKQLIQTRVPLKKR